MTQALVYLDEGVCYPSAEALSKQLKTLLGPSIDVLKVDSHYLKTEAWQGRTVILAMPGGKCRFWDEKLGAEGINKIHDYVMKGGRYLGVCAGAYFAAAEAEFDKMGKKRALSFFPGKAIGPLMATDDYLQLKAARALPVTFKIQDHLVQGAVYYQGGCFFDIEEDSENVEIVSRYEGINKAASLFCRVGKGQAFLCGQHPEFEWSPVKCQESYYEELSEALSAQEPYRRMIWEEIGRKLKI